MDFKTALLEKKLCNEAGQGKINMYLNQLSFCVVMINLVIFLTFNYAIISEKGASKNLDIKTALQAHIKRLTSDLETDVKPEELPAKKHCQ